MPYTAKFPSSIATDSDLKVALNNFSTTLRSAMSAGETTMVVAEATRITANMLLTIDLEIVNVVSKAGNVLTVVRGFDDTTAVAHSNNRPVHAYIDAWHHNSLKEELKSIESALGPNLTNLTTQGVLSTRTNFTAQTPGGALVVGANSITLTPVPAGVNGTDANHYLYISGGTGTPEAVLIIGGSAVSGAASGTVIVSATSAHTGAWTIQSATAGIQEALNTLDGANGGTVSIPAGTFPIRGPITVNEGNTAIVGVRGTTLTDLTAAGKNLVTFRPVTGTARARNTIQGLMVSSTKTTDAAVIIDGQNTFLIRDCYINGGTAGIVVTGNEGNYNIFIEDCNVSLSYQTGACVAILANGALKASGVYLDHVQLSLGATGLYVTGVGGLYMNHCDLIAQVVGMVLAPGNNAQVAFAWITDTTVDTSTSSGIMITPSGTGALTGVEFTNCWTASHGGSGVVLTGGGSTVLNGVRFIGCRAVNCQGHGFDIGVGAKNVHLIECTVSGNSTLNPGTLYGVNIAPGVSDFVIRGGTYGPSDSFTIQHGIDISVAAGASDRYFIHGVKILGTGGLQDRGTGLYKIIKDNMGPSPTAGIASASAITLPVSDLELYTITGTTQIITINGGWVGRTIQLLFMHATPAGLGTGGNIGRTRTAVYGETISLTYSGVGWY